MRVERDSMGEMQVPDDALYGASTQRAILNFPISGQRFPRVFLRALGLIKQAAAEANRDLLLLEPSLAEAISLAAGEVADGQHDAQFPVDIFQTGSGTSTNMNANEVIANRAAAILGRAVHPNDHVNLGQSSNDVIPTTIQLAASLAIEEELAPALRALEAACAAKADEFMPVIKTGRTHLQDATPIRMGQVFAGYAGQAERALRRLEYARSEMRELALGGTAVGTGVNTHPDFARRACEKLAARTGLALQETTNHFQAQSTLDGTVLTSAVLKTAAISVYKIADDLRWMGSGPRAGFGELELPAVQPGSSIMPGKVNPVIAESTMMACAQVISNDLAVTIAGQSGNFELNTMMPLAARNLLESITLLAAAIENLVGRCINGLKATARGPELVERGLMLATGLAPLLGYEAAAKLAKEAHETGRTIRELARERTNLSEEEIDSALDPEKLTRPGLSPGMGSGG